MFRLPNATLHLASTPGILRAWLAGLPEPCLRVDEGPGTFSARDILAHLIHGERTDWMPRLRLIREFGEDRPFEPFDRDGFLKEARAMDLDTLLDMFASLRAANLAELEDLNLAEWDLNATGSHPAFGRVSVRELLASWVVHDLDHLGQIARVMAKSYTTDVGPWVHYLPILMMGKFKAQT